jgi:hypothetical protein
MGTKARLLHYTIQEKLSRDKPSSLLGPLVSYEENEVLWLFSQNPIFIITYEWAQKLECYNTQYTIIEAFQRQTL